MSNSRSCPVSGGGRDSVDDILAQWASERPDLDFSPVGVITRLARVRAYLDAALAEVFEGFGLTPADFLVIVTLRRVGVPYRLPQARLMTALGLTSGTVSVRLARLESSGIVHRDSDPGDKRTHMVTLTDSGLRLFDEIAPVHLAGEDRLLSALDPAERDHLAQLLRKLLVSYESTGAQAHWLWGMRLEAAHVARHRRTQVGLSDTPGMLVGETLPGSPAAIAGLTRGDLITGAADRPVYDLCHLIEAAAPGRPISLRVLRGDTPMETTLTVSDRADGPPRAKRTPREGEP
ncbi:MAG: MarR family transcriptional regulator [Actinoallomurus sp.]